VNFRQKDAVDVVPYAIPARSSSSGPSLGLFATWQVPYARLGLPTFPVRGKKPAVRGYLRVDVDTSRKLARKFSYFDAFGLALPIQADRIML
jgi:hypothetical protein